MGTPDGRDRMLKRHEIVVRIIDANAKDLRLANAFIGLDVERRNAERELTAAAPPTGAREALADIEKRMDAIDQDRAKLAAEKAWLDEVLAEFDKPQRAEPRSGEA